MQSESGLRVQLAAPSLSSPAQQEKERERARARARRDRPMPSGAAPALLLRQSLTAMASSVRSAEGGLELLRKKLSDVRTTHNPTSLSSLAAVCGGCWEEDGDRQHDSTKSTW